MFSFPSPPNSDNIVVISDISPPVSQFLMIRTLKTFGPMKLLFSQDLIRTSKKIAFVTYTHSKDANMAINGLNHFEIIKGFPINATKLRTSLGNSAILLEDLPNDVSIEEVDDALKNFGTIFCSKLCRNGCNEPLGYGYVDFESEKAAKACLSHKTPIIIKGKPLNLEPYPEFGNQIDKIKKILYLRNFGNVPEGKSEEEFVKDKKSEFLLTFSKPDSNIIVASIEIKKNFSGKYFALIGYLSKEECDLIYMNFKKKSDNNPMIVCQLEERLLQETVIKAPPSTNASLYTKGLRKNIDNETVQAVFAQFGTVLSCRVTDPPNPKILTRQGFINFKNNEEASTALNEAKDNKDVQELYENGEVYLNWCNDLNNKKKIPQMVPIFYPPPMMYPPPPTAIGGYFNRMQEIENMNLRETGSAIPKEKKKEEKEKVRTFLLKFIFSCLDPSKTRIF